MRVVVTGGDGFIGRNLRVRLNELGHIVRNVTRRTSDEELSDALSQAEFVFHLAGVSRPQHAAAFESDNVGFTEQLCRLLADGRKLPLLFASSTQAALDNAYGRSKLAAERAVERYSSLGARTIVLRLPNVFGKWSRPNYNSAVATFCHNLAHGLPITVDDPTAVLKLVYVDDVVDAMIALMTSCDHGFVDVAPIYNTTVGSVAEILTACARNRETLQLPAVGAGLTRALYATYVSYLSADRFAYQLPQHGDGRGVFVEVLKTRDAGQVSYFTVAPGVTRGEHYHHTKAEKFVVLCGHARFGFRNLTTDETHEIIVAGADAAVVETVPGWAHDVTNIGTTEMIVLVWANEIFDPRRPDTIACPVAP